jgi:hypothetical protein
MPDQLPREGIHRHGRHTYCDTGASIATGCWMLRLPLLAAEARVRHSRVITDTVISHHRYRLPLLAAEASLAATGC